MPWWFDHLDRRGERVPLVTAAPQAAKERNRERVLTQSAKDVNAFWHGESGEGSEMAGEDSCCTHFDKIESALGERAGIAFVIWSCPVCGMRAEIMPGTLRVFLYRGRPPREFMRIHDRQPSNVIENAGGLTTYEWWVHAIQAEHVTVR